MAAILMRSGLFLTLLVPLTLTADTLQVPAPPGTTITSTITGQTDGINWVAGWSPLVPPQPDMGDNGGFYYIGFDQPVAAGTLTIVWRENAPDNGVNYVPPPQDETRSYDPFTRTETISAVFPDVSSTVLGVRYFDGPNYTPAISFTSLIATDTPEPSTWLLAGSAMLALLIRRGMLAGLTSDTVIVRRNLT
jgi:hypothetical protein